MKSRWTTVLDAGNTALKIGQFENNELVTTHVIGNDEIDSTKVLEYIKGTPIYSASGKWLESLIQLTLQLNGLVASIDLNIPLSIGYSTPSTLGLDRISNVCGARAVVKQGNLLVIDVGTCITYDILTAKDHYLGGAISPGIGIRFKGMNNLTEQTCR